MLNKSIDFQKPKSSNCGDCELCTHTVDNRRVRIQSQEIAAIESIIDHYTREDFEAAFGDCFEILDHRPSGADDRVLYLMKSRQTVGLRLAS